MSSFKQSFPRKWFFEKRDWIVSDEVEDETEEMTEEELVAEEEVNLQNFFLSFFLSWNFCQTFFPQMVIPTVAVEADKKENTVCPVCREEFATFYKQVGRLLVSFLIVGVVSVTHLCLFRTAARVTRVVGITTEETRVSFALISTTTRYGCQQV